MKTKMQPNVAAMKAGRSALEQMLATGQATDAQIEAADAGLKAAENYQRGREAHEWVEKVSSMELTGEIDPDHYDPQTLEVKSPEQLRQYKDRNGGLWAKSVVSTLGRAASGIGVKALLNGEVAVPPAVEVVPLPDVPVTFLDLVQRTELNGNDYSYLSQVARTNNADVVADGAIKPTSQFKFEEVRGRARVVAHLSEPFPLRFFDDYDSMMMILDQEMRMGVLQALERQLIAGNGQGENFHGILSTTGVTDVPFSTDALTTARTARSVLAAKGEVPSAWVLNPEDAAALELTRENGATGGFLMSGGAYDVIFGEGVKRVTSTQIPKGTALLGDWSQVRLYVRQTEHTLAATQADGLWEKNQVKLRAEGRYGIQMLRPQAVAVVHLAGA